MNDESAFCNALHFANDQQQNSSVTTPPFFVCCAKENIWFDLAPDALWTRKDMARLCSGPPMCVAKLTDRDRDQSAPASSEHTCLKYCDVHGVFENELYSKKCTPPVFHSTIKMQGRIYLFMGAMLPKTRRGPSFLSVHTHDADYKTHSRARLGRSRRLSSNVLPDLTAVLHPASPYVHIFQSLRECAHHDKYPAAYRMVLHAYRKPAFNKLVNLTVLRRRRSQQSSPETKIEIELSETLSFVDAAR